MKDGQQIRFAGEGDQEPDREPGDVVIVLDEKEHNVFQRKGIDLRMQQEITLTEALCGFHHVIQTLDNRSLVITSLPGMSAAVEFDENLSRILSCNAYHNAYNS